MTVLVGNASCIARWGPCFASPGAGHVRSLISGYGSRVASLANSEIGYKVAIGVRFDFGCEDTASTVMSSATATPLPSVRVSQNASPIWPVDVHMPGPTTETV